MKILIEAHGKRRYAYLYTSRRVSDKKNPVVTKRYLGIYDEDTGLIAPKHVPPERFLSEIHDDEFVAYDIGSVLLALRAAESSGIAASVERSFGSTWRTVLAAILVLSAGNAPVLDYHAAMSGYYLNGILGGALPGRTALNRSLRDVKRGISDCVASIPLPEKVFVIPFRGILSRHGRLNTESGANVSGSYTFFVSDIEGDPIAVRFVDGGVSPGQAYAAILSRISRSSEGTLVLDLSSEPPAMLPELVLAGRRFVASAGSLANTLMPAVYGMFGRSSRTEAYRGSEYEVLEFDVGLIRGSEGWEAEALDAGQHGDSPLRVRAVAWYDRMQHEDTARIMDMMIRHKREELKQMGFEEASRVLDHSPLAYEVLNLSEGPDGRARVAVRRDAKERVLLHAGITLVITDSCGWKECMDSIRAEAMTASDSRSLMSMIGDPDSGFTHTGAFLSFMAMRLRTHLRRMASESGIDGLSVDDMFNTASQYKVVDVNGTLYRSRIPKTTEELFRKLDVDCIGPSLLGRVL